MAQKVQILLTCDIDGSDDGVETVMFTYEGTTYALELCAKDREAFATSMERYTQPARKQGSARSSASRRASNVTTFPSEDVNEIRAWAKANGYRVADRGRVSSEVREAYRAAHS